MKFEEFRKKYEEKLKKYGYELFENSLTNCYDAIDVGYVVYTKIREDRASDIRFTFGKEGDPIKVELVVVTQDGIKDYKFTMDELFDFLEKEDDN